MDPLKRKSPVKSVSHIQSLSFHLQSHMCCYSTHCRGFKVIGSKPVFIPFSDTMCLFLDVALFVEILKGSFFPFNDYWVKHRAFGHFVDKPF